LFEVWGGTKEPAENENEIIQNISKKTTIEKATFYTLEDLKWDKSH
jgi:hypothetical protein